MNIVPEIFFINVQSTHYSVPSAFECLLIMHPRAIQVFNKEYQNGLIKEILHTEMLVEKKFSSLSLKKSI